MKSWPLTFILILVINALAIYAALFAAPPEEHLGESYRILYVHVPSAWVGYLAFGVAFIASILFLARRSVAFDALAFSSVYIGIVYVSAALLTGAIWANVAWGAYWNWDPRETATLVLWLAYVGYLALRASIPSLEKKMVASAVYATAAFFTVPMSYISAFVWRTLHPLVFTSLQDFKLSPPMVETLIFNVFAATLLYIYIQTILYKLEIQDYQICQGGRLNAS